MDTSPVSGFPRQESKAKIDFRRKIRSPFWNMFRVTERHL
jgi:hypothetical protein